MCWSSNFNWGWPFVLQGVLKSLFLYLVPLVSGIVVYIYTEPQCVATGRSCYRFINKSVFDHVVLNFSVFPSFSSWFNPYNSIVSQLVKLVKGSKSFNIIRSTENYYYFTEFLGNLFVAKGYPSACSFFIPQGFLHTYIDIL